jgi:DNA-binding winged helix-turn-helix (wHTH) protein
VSSWLAAALPSPDACGPSLWADLLLSFLVDGEGKILERRTIYRRVWGGLMSSENRSVYTYIRRLRVRLRDASPGWDYIQCHPRSGYCFEPRPSLWRPRLSVPSGEAQPTVTG